MTSGSPFIVVPWQTPFLPALLELACEHTGNAPGNAVMIFPHARPARYMDIHIREHSDIAKPCVMPRMEPVSTLFSLIRTQTEQRPALTIGILDQVALLLSCVRDVRDNAGGLLRDLPLDDSRRFFPWGIRLANLMEEFFTHARLPGDYSSMEGQVSSFAAALLENLSTLHKRYMEALDERAWTTPGYDAFKAASYCQSTAEIDGLSGKALFLAGFHTLTGTQEILFRHLWENYDATICLHADAAIADKSTHAHWSCTELIRWAQRWKTHTTVRGEVPDKAPAIRYKAGYDLHSQLASMSQELSDAQQKNGELEHTAVVLPDTGLLLPTLHHLPHVDVNISMGYPLARSPLFRLLDVVLRMQETRRSHGKRYEYHWKSCIAIVRHPYIKMLLPEERKDQESDPQKPDKNFGLRRLMHRLEQRLRTGRRFADLSQLVDSTLLELPPEENDPPAQELLRSIIAACVTNWQEVHCAEDLAKALESLVSLLLRHGQRLWPRFPIDAECLYRLMQSILPSLAHTELKKEPLPAATLYSMLRELLRAERVPFEADPLVGLQVVGMLETRLLHFSRLYILDATDDILPGAPRHDPLLPDALRALAGLPDSKGRERLVAYTFFRLIAAADEVTLFWQEGVEPQGLSDGKKLRSRFIEELLWNAEKARGRIFGTHDTGNDPDSPLHNISCQLPPLTVDNRSIPITPVLRERMRHLLSGPVSPSLLDAYLRCPVRFFYERLGRIQQPDTVMEDGDPIALGTLMHEVLHAYFSERRNIAISCAKQETNALKNLFLQHFSASALYTTLPLEARLMLEESGPERLERMLAAQEGSVPMWLEEELQATITVKGRIYTLSGVVDRIDQRDGSYVVLDYKTGHIPYLAKQIWNDDFYWQQLAQWEADAADTHDLLPDLASRLGSVQLPCYIYMFSSATGRDIINAAYIELRDGGKEYPLFGGKMDEDHLSVAIDEQIPGLISFILRHMGETNAFFPHKGAHCRWCPCRGMCIVLPQGESECHSL